jgi:fumarylacetoacetase
METSTRSFISYPADSDFPIQNLPYGVFYRNSDQAKTPAVGVAIGDQVLDLTVIAKAGLFDGSALKDHANVFAQVRPLALKTFKNNEKNFVNHKKIVLIYLRRER